MKTYQVRNYTQVSVRLPVPWGTISTFSSGQYVFYTNMGTLWSGPGGLETVHGLKLDSKLT